MNIAEKLWSVNKSNTPLLGELEACGDWLLLSFEEFMGVKIYCFRKHFVEGESLTYAINSRTNEQSPLNVSWEARLMLSIDDEPSIDVELLLFVNGFRVGCGRDNGNSILVYRYEKSDGGNGGVWHYVDWFDDEFEEYSSIKDISTRMKFYENFERSKG